MLQSHITFPHHHNQGIATNLLSATAVKNPRNFWYISLFQSQQYKVQGWWSNGRSLHSESGSWVVQQSDVSSSGRSRPGSSGCGEAPNGSGRRLVVAGQAAGEKRQGSVCTLFSKEHRALQNHHIRMYALAYVGGIHHLCFDVSVTNKPTLFTLNQDNGKH